MGSEEDAVQSGAASLPGNGLRQSVGARLRAAREAQKLSRGDVAQTTRIAERMLAALEEGNYAALPARTYATGFARSYARAVGLDAESVVRDVRLELDGAPDRSDRAVIAAFEPGDPARVPSRRTAWLALAALIVIGAALLVFRSFNQPEPGLPSILPPETPAPAPVVAPPAPAPTPQPTGPVVFTAREAAWVRLSDGGKTLLQKDIAAGESFSVPESAVDPRLRSGRPDLLSITIGGRPVPPLAEKQQLVADVPVSAAALLARTTPAPSAVPSTSAAPAAPGRPKPVQHPRAPASPAASAAPAEAPPTPPAAADPSTAQR